MPLARGSSALPSVLLEEVNSEMTHTYSDAVFLPEKCPRWEGKSDFKEGKIGKVSSLIIKGGGGGGGGVTPYKKP